MIKLSLNSPETSSKSTPAPFSSALAAAVEAAAAQPEQPTLAQVAVKKEAKPVRTPAPSRGLLSRGVQWLQQKGRSKKRLHMIETVSLGDKRFVALVKVDGREFLLGGAPSSVGMLADLGAHGLGDLLSVATPIASVIKEPVNVSPKLEEAASRSLSAVTATVAEHTTKEPEAEFAKTLAFSLPAPVAPASEPSVPLAAERLSVVVEADIDESDWALEDEMQDLLRSATEMEPKSKGREFGTEAEVSLQPEIAPVPCTVEKLGPVIVPAPVTFSTPMATTVPQIDVNFTFQMWPAATTRTAQVEPQASVVAPVHAGPVPVATRSRKHIDLESCPELLGEPYVLALLDGSQGAAA